MNELELFAAAVAVADPTERALLLDRECAGDSAKRARLEALLRAHDRPDSLLDRPAVAPRDPDTATTCTIGHEGGAAADDEVPLGFLAPAARPDALGRLGHYEVLEVLGRGGFGIVFRAFDETLQRVVAIKMMSPQLAVASPARKRFLREARTAAKVRHEHVVQIYAVEEQPIPYLVMEYIPGGTLQQTLDASGPLETVTMLQVAVQLTRGLAAAHAQDLIHRDIKPGNVLLERGVEPHAKLTDFGLARAADDASLTQSGTVAGTPMYMSPEQAEGKAVDQRADLFSLGSVFYVMLSGRRPFRAASTMAVLRRVCEDTPRPIREIIPEVPEWLCHIVAKLHAKKPEDRFQTAAEVADLLAGHLAHSQQPHKVPMPPPVAVPTITLETAPAGSRDSSERKAAPARRRRTALVAVAAGLLLAVGLTIAYFATRQQNHQTAENDNPPVENSPPPVADKTGLKPTDEFFAALKRENIPPHLLALAGGGDPDQAPPELVAVLGDGRFVLPNGGIRDWMAHSPDGKLLAVPCGYDVALFDALTGALVRTLRGHTGHACRPAFSSDGERLATCSEDGTARIWNIQAGNIVSINKLHSDFFVTLSPDGKRAASGGRNGNLHIWETETGKELWVLTGHSGIVYRATFSPDGTRIVSVGHDDHKVMIWDAATGQLVKKLEDHTATLRGLALNAKGDRMATGSDTELILWSVDWKSDEYKLVRKVATEANWLAFDPDGQTLLTGKGVHANSFPEATRWDLDSGERIGSPLTFQRQGEWAYYELSPDSKTLFVTGGGVGGTAVPFVRAYDAHTGKELFERQGHTGEVWSVAVSPDGKLLASGGADKTVRLWDLAAWAPGQPLPPARKLTGHTDAIWSLAFSPDGKLLASGSFDTTIVLWDPASGKQVRTLTGHSSAWSRLVFSPDGATVAAGSADGKVQRWDVASGRRQDPLLGHQGHVKAVAYSPDGTLLASTGEDRTARLYEVATGRPLHTFALGQMWGLRVAFTPDSATLLVIEANMNSGLLRLFDIKNHKEVGAALPLLGRCDGLALQPKGSLWVTSDTVGGAVQLSDHSAKATRVLTLGPGPFGVPDVAFSPEGRYLATANTSGTVSILRVPEPPKTTVPSSPPKQIDPVALAAQSSPADALDRKNIPEELLKKAGDGDPANAPQELVAVLAPPQPTAPAKWIWYPDEGDPAKNAPAETRWFRKKFDLDKLAGPVPGAVLRITADDEFTAYLNGVEVGSGDKLSVYHFDVARHVVPGVNVLAVRAQNNVGPAGLLAQLTIVSGNQSPVVIVSDGSWNSAQKGPPDWQQPNFDDSPWQAARELGVPGSTPIWRELRWSGTPGEKRIAISPDGKTLAAAGSDRVMSLWNLADAGLRSIWTGHDAEVRGLAFSPNGKLLASAGADGTVRLWDAARGKPVRVLHAPGADLWGAAFSPDGSLLAASSRDGAVRLWNAADGKIQRVLRGHSGFVPRLAFSPDGKLLATAGFDDRRARLWDLATGWQLRDFPQDGPVQSVAFSADGRYLAISTNNRHIWDLGRQQLSCILPGGAWQVAFRPDGRMLATVGHELGVKLWDVDTKPEKERVLSLFKGGPIPHVAFTPEGRYLATANPDDTVYVLRLAEKGEVLRVFPEPAELRPKVTWVAHARPVTTVLFAEGNATISAGKDGYVRRWPVEPPKGPGGANDPIQKIAAQEDGVRTIARTPDGKTLATAGFDGLIRLWDSNGAQLCELPGHKDGTAALAFSADGVRLFSGGADGQIRVWSVKDGKQTGAFQIPANQITHLSLALDGKTLAVSGTDVIVRLLDADTGKVRTSLPECTAAWFSPNGKSLALALPTGVIELRDADTHDVHVRLRGLTEPPESLSFSADSKRLAACGQDGTLYLWDVSSRHLLAVLRGHQGRPRCVALSADGQLLAAGDEGGNLLVLDLSGLTTLP